MLNYIRAEFYKVFRRSYTWITLIVVLALEALLAAGWVFTNAHGNDWTFYEGTVIVVVCLSMGLYATLLTGDMVFAGQYKNATLKNEVSFGLSRTRIYLGKLAVQTILSMLFCVVMLAFYEGVCWLTLYHDPDTDLQALQILGYSLVTVFPLWIGVQALTCACMFLIKSELGAALTCVGIFSVLPQGFWLLANLAATREALGNVCMTIYNHTPAVMVDTIKEIAGDWAYCGKAWIVGAVWFAVSTAVGLWGFHRKEIK